MKNGNLYTAMTSRCRLSSQTKYFLLLVIVYFFAGYLRLAHSKGLVGIIKLQHAYAGLAAPSKKNSGTGTTKEQIQLFKAHDRARHGRLLANVVQFPLGGSSNPFVAGIYYTKVILGAPPKEYYVQVDTGSDLLWLNCNPCAACPRSNDLGMKLMPYDPHTSSTSSMIACKDLICDRAFKVGNSACDSTQLCSYFFQYGDGSSTTGYLVADTLVYDTVQLNDTLSKSEANIVFGCGYSQAGNLLTAQNVVDGIIGFGQSKLSVISQLYAQGLTSGVFAHCLQGSDRGGGVLILGDVVNQEMVYTPIIPSQLHYNVNLRGISVGGSPVIFNSAVHETADQEGTIFDSGTTLAYIQEPVYSSFIANIINKAPSGAHLIYEQGIPCFIWTNSIADAFPLVTLHFEGADMTLTAKHYLIQQQGDENFQPWCIGWHPISSGSTTNSGLLTILGDIVLKDQLVVYDLENQRIGWANYDCSSSVLVSMTSGKSESVSPHELRNSATLPFSQPLLFNLLFAIFICITLL